MTDSFKLNLTFRRDWDDAEAKSRMGELMKSLEELGVKATVRVVDEGTADLIFNGATSRALLATTDPTAQAGEGK